MVHSLPDWTSVVGRLTALQVPYHTRSMKYRCARLFIGIALLLLAINLRAQDLAGDMGLWKVLPDD